MTQTNSTMEDEILDIVNEVLNNADKSQVDGVDRETSLTNDLGMESIDLAELTVRIEDRYGVDVFEDGTIDTIGEIFDIIGNS